MKKHLIRAAGHAATRTGEYLFAHRRTIAQALLFAAGMISAFDAPSPPPQLRRIPAPRPKR